METQIPTQEEFFTLANGRRTSRILTAYDYRRFCQALSDAQKAADKSESYCKFGSTGGPSNPYGSDCGKPTGMAGRWAVWVDTDLQVRWVVDQVVTTGIMVPLIINPKRYHAEFVDARAARS